LKFIVDAQLPPALAGWLRDHGHQAEHVQDVGLREAEDSPIWQYALIQRSVILTKDEDFAARARQVKQDRETPVIVWLRIGNCSNRALQKWFVPLLPEIVREIESGQRFIEVR
jgi:predicted nuclease of predicted toxin-antitoxin system